MTIIITNSCDMNLNRKEKAELLKNILDGKLCISDMIEPRELKMVIHIGRQNNGREYFINGKEVSKESFEEVDKRTPNTQKPEIRVRIGNKLLSKD